MRAILPILWRLVLTLVALLFLASCGIEQSKPASSFPAASAPARTALATFSVTPSPSASGLISTPTLVSPTVSASPTPLELIVTLADHGRTITLQVGDQFLLELDINYVWQVAVTDTSVLNRIPTTAGKDNQGVYAAYRQGSVTLTATGTPLCYNAVPRCLMPSRFFSLHINVRGASGSELTITAADNGKTVTLAVGQTFLLNLGSDYDWTVTVDDPKVVNRVPNVSVPKGTQGIFEAQMDGTTALRATGIIVCPPGKACIQIALEFRVQLIVK